MKRTSLPIAISVFIFACLPSVAFTQNDPSPDDIKYGALAIDRANGVYYGWAIDCLTLAEAEEKAIEACNEKGGNCSVVLSFSGKACAAYRHITGNVGMGYGWGIAQTAEEADAKAKKECAERSYGLPAPNHDSRCSSPDAGELKVIYDAHDELKLVLPGAASDY